MSTTCQNALDGVGSGVAASLRAVDCAANAMAQGAFGRLFGPNGELVAALTILLALFVALIGFALITGRTRIGIAQLTPRMMTLGLVLTFATSWAAYHSVVWNLATGAPDEIARALMGTPGQATHVFADKIDIVFLALIEASGGGAMDGATSTFSPQGLLWLGATLLLLGTVGVLATAKIALAVLLALGPVFFVLALFDGTRGLFVGWLKGVVLLAIAPLFAVLGGSLMLELAVPVINALTETPGKIEPRAAMAFFLIGAVHAALMVLVMKVAATMVSGWTVFGLAQGGSDREGGATSMTRGSGPIAAQPARSLASVPGSPAPSREIRVTSAPSAANDPGLPQAAMRRETHVLAGTGGAFGAGPSANPAPSRARGVGSRFRSVPPRPLEKMK